MDGFINQLWGLHPKVQLLFKLQWVTLMAQKSSETLNRPERVSKDSCTLHNMDKALSYCSNLLVWQVWTHYPTNWILNLLWGSLYTRSQCQCLTQIKHPYWCKSWNQPPRGFTLWVMAEIEKYIFNLPQITNRCWPLWPYIGPKAEKRIPSNLGSQFAPVGPNCSCIFLISWHQCSSTY
jgi:hypothetical protein